MGRPEVPARAIGLAAGMVLLSPYRTVGIAYLVGATPTAYLAGRLLRGIDIREHGSGSTGATNVLRTLGPWAALGVLLAMAWPVGVGALAAFGVVVAVFRIVSLGSIVAAATAIALICGLEQPTPYRLLVIAGGLYVIARHRANIRRLLAGTEPRLGRPAPAERG